MKKTILPLLLFPVIALAVYAGMILWQKGPINPWVSEPSVVPTVELIIPADVRFVDVIEIEEEDGNQQSAALLADSKGRTALLPQNQENLSRLPDAQRLAVSVLSQYQHNEQSFGRLEVATTRRFKNLKTGEYRDFAPNQYPTSGDWVPETQ